MARKAPKTRNKLTPRILKQNRRVVRFEPSIRVLSSWIKNDRPARERPGGLLVWVVAVFRANLVLLGVNEGLDEVPPAVIGNVVTIQSVLYVDEPVVRVIISPVGRSD